MASGKDLSILFGAVESLAECKLLPDIPPARASAEINIEGFKWKPGAPLEFECAEHGKRELLLPCDCVDAVDVGELAEAMGGVLDELLPKINERFARAYERREEALEELERLLLVLKWLLMAWK